VSELHVPVGLAMVVAALASAAPAAAETPAAASPPAPPPAVLVPVGSAPSPQPQSQPEWTPPGDGTAGGEGNLHDAPLFSPSGEMRHFTLTYNPLTLFLVRAELSLEIVLCDHHAIQLTGFYGSTRTNEVYPSAGDVSHADALTTLFSGGGGELGYRWYSGTGGARGFFVAPSFLLAHYTAAPARGAGTSTEMDGPTTPFWNLGGALDVGWQAIFADRWVAGLGAGLQYTVPTHAFPSQELPASVYADKGLRPRALMALGVAF
jgi:hypothetical protein